MLTWEQRGAARAIYEGVMTDKQICKRWRISARRLAACRGDAEFARYLDGLCEAAERRTRCILSRNGPAAAAKLAEIIGSGTSDVTRRAALDLIRHCLKRPEAGEATDELPSMGEAMTDEEARELLQALVDEDEEKKSKKEK